MMRMLLAPRENVKCNRTARTKVGLQGGLSDALASRMRLWRVFPPSSSLRLPTSTHAFTLLLHRATPIDRQSHAL